MTEGATWGKFVKKRPEISCYCIFKAYEVAKTCKFFARCTPSRRNGPCDKCMTSLRNEYISGTMITSDWLCRWLTSQDRNGTYPWWRQIWLPGNWELHNVHGALMYLYANVPPFLSYVLKKRSPYLLLCTLVPPSFNRNKHACVIFQKLTYQRVCVRIELLL